MGAITLNTLVCALLYHPVEEHMMEVPIDDGIDNDALSLDEPVTATKLHISLPGKSDDGQQGTTNAHCESTSSHLSDLSKYLEKTLSESADDGAAQIKEKSFVSESQESVEEIKRDEAADQSVAEINESVTINCEIGAAVGAENAKDNSVNNTTPSLSRANSARKSGRNDSSFHLSRQHSIVSDMGPIALSPRVPGLFRRIFKTQTPKRQSSLNRDENAMESAVVDDDKSAKKKKLDEDSSQSIGSSMSFFDFSVLHDPIYLVILISNSTSAISNTNFMILLPSYAISEGFDKNMSALLLSIVSALDLVGRIGGASLSDIDFIPKYYYFVGGLGLSGIALALLPMATSYTMLSFFCALFGLSSGMYIGITTVILADMLGTEKLSSSYGISLFVNGVLQLVGPPLCGVIFEQVGSYKPIFLALGIILILGTALWAAVPIIKRNKKEVEAA